MAQSIERLGDALAGAGGDRPQRPTDTSIVDSIERRIAPFQLHEDVRELWMTVDMRRLPFHTDPRWQPPQFCLDSWENERSDDEGFTMVPRAFFMIGYA